MGKLKKAGGVGTVVENSPHYLKVDGSSPAAAVGTN